VTRSNHESLRDVTSQLAQTKQYSASHKLRKKVEMSFAHLKKLAKPALNQNHIGKAA
jgi:hypothetical protein